MREHDFEHFLNSEPNITSPHGIRIRISCAKQAEDILGKTLDAVVADDDTMYDALVQLRSYDIHNAKKQNAVRKYYKFINGKEFPRLKNYHSAKHL